MHVLFLCNRTGYLTTEPGLEPRTGAQGYSRSRIFRFSTILNTWQSLERRRCYVDNVFWLRVQAAREVTIYIKIVPGRGYFTGRRVNYNCGYSVSLGIRDIENITHIYFAPLIVKGWPSWVSDRFSSRSMKTRRSFSGFQIRTTFQVSCSPVCIYILMVFVISRCP